MGILAAVTFAFAVAELVLAAALLRRERRSANIARAEARASRTRLAEIEKLAHVGNWEFDVLANRIHWSDEVFNIFGLRAGEHEPDFADVLLSIEADDAPSFDRAIQHCMATGDPYSLDMRVHTPDGSIRHVHAQGSAVRDESGRVHRLLGTMLDITERKRAESRLAREASCDALTGLFNRRYLLSRMEDEMRLSRERGAFLMLCICDVDEFKLINDTFGHSAGDEVLRQFSRLLRESVRSGDVVARLGGDEFCIILPGASASQAQACVERIRTRFENASFTCPSGSRYRATATFGIAGFEAPMGVQQLLDAADAALYEAKQSGRNRCAIA